MDTLNTYRIIMIEMSVLLLSNLLRLLFIYFFNEMVCLKFEWIIVTIIDVYHLQLFSLFKQR